MSEPHTHDVDLTLSGLKGYEGQMVIRLPCADPNCEIARLKTSVADLTLRLGALSACLRISTTQLTVEYLRREIRRALRGREVRK